MDFTHESGAFLGAAPPKQAALDLAFQVAQHYGDTIREMGWTSLLGTILRAAHLQILPDSMCHLDDFAGGKLNSFSMFDFFYFGCVEFVDMII